MPRPQYTLKTLLVAMLVVAAFFGGVRFERERRRRADEEAAALAAKAVPLRLPSRSARPPLDRGDFPGRAEPFRLLPGYVKPVDEVPFSHGRK